MKGKICVVTGATSGIGEEIAAEFVRRGAKVGIVGRNPAKLDATATRMDGPVDTFLADLSLLTEVRKLAEGFHESYDRIDVLVNNAGVHAFEPRTTSEGFDAMVVTNYLAPFLLTNLVRDLLEAAAPSRVVVTASEAHRNGGKVALERLAQPQSYSRIGSFRTYGNSKLLDLLFTQELARRLEGTGVTANSFCPGTVNTGLVGESRLLGLGASVLSRTPFIRRPDQGAQMGIRLATDPELADTSGEFFTSTPGMRFLPPVSARGDAELQRRLWDRTAELTGP